MRLLFIADGRSPIALNWIGYFLARGDEVHLVSTYPCEPLSGLSSFTVIPVAFSTLKTARLSRGEQGRLRRGLWKASPSGVRLKLRQWLAPFTLPRAAQALRRVICSLHPDLVHAMRIPYEGMLAALAQPSAPLLLSVWGNDFTLHARATPFMRLLTRHALQRADALHADCQRDIHLARLWGFEDTKLTLVLPGAGGVQLEVFYPPAGWEATEEAIEREIVERGKTILQPRGFRAYVRNDVFFRAIPFVLQEEPRARFICPNMLHEPQAEKWVAQAGVEAAVQLLPAQSRAQMAQLYRQARVMVSPSEHDGTPNTLLESMASGCLPVAGDLDSIREWLTHGENGLLCDPGSAFDLAQAMLHALRDNDLYRRARARNLQLVCERAAYHAVMPQAASFYEKVALMRPH